MEPSKASMRRPINVKVLESQLTLKKLKTGKAIASGQSATFAPEELVPIIRAEVGSEVPRVTYTYRVLIPLAHITRELPDAFRRVTIVGRDEIAILRDMLIQHFGGVTMEFLDPSPTRGVGARNPDQPLDTLEENEHITFDIYAAPIQESDDYFRTLRKELQEALGEGVILIERREVTLL